MTETAAEDHPRSRYALAALLLLMGVLHFVMPKPFMRIVPPLLGAPRFWTYASGVAELVCAAGLLHPRTRSLAGWASLAVLLTVYPANFKMAGDALKTDNQTFKAAALARLPLQLPMIRAAYRAAKGGM